MAQTALNERMRSVIFEAKSADFFSEDELRGVEEDLLGDRLSVSSLKCIKNFLKKNPQAGSLSDIYLGSSDVLKFNSKSDPSIPVNDEKEKRKDYLNRVQQTKEYNQMVFGSVKDPVLESKEKEMSSFVSYRHQASVGANVIISSGGMAVVMYYVGTKFLPNKQHCLLLGVLGAVLMMIVEMILYIFRAGQIDKMIAADKEKMKSSNLVNESFLPPKPKKE